MIPRGVLALLVTAGLLVWASVPGIAVDRHRRVPARSAANANANANAVEVVQTSADLSQRLTRLPDLEFGTVRARGVPVIHVDDRVQYQRIRGFGASMTDSSAWLLYDKLSPTTRAAAMSRLFSSAGIHLSFVRVPMGASDFTRNGVSYSYDDLPGRRADPTLARFSIAHDEAYILPVLREMLAINPHVELLANPWSPPAWMKSNHTLANWPLDRPGHLLASMFGPLAHYFVKFLKAYAGAGVPIGAVTPQNEPGQPTNAPGMALPERSEARWIVHYLRPALAAAGLRTRIYGLDFHWAAGASGPDPYAPRLVSNPAVRRTIAGIAWHCYAGNPEAMTTVRDLAPHLDQIEDECSSEIAPGAPAELVIASTRNWASAVLLWNLALNPQGGPVLEPHHGCSVCTAPATVDEHTGGVSYGCDYYQLGQASSFVAPGAHRIKTNHFVSYQFTRLELGRNYATTGLDDVAFENPDGSRVLLAYNNNPSRAVKFAVEWHKRWFSYKLAPGATVTFVWRQPGGPVMAGSLAHAPAGPVKIIKPCGRVGGG